MESAVEMDALHRCRGRHVAIRRSKHSVSLSTKSDVSPVVEDDWIYRVVPSVIQSVLSSKGHVALWGNFIRLRQALSH